MSMKIKKNTKLSVEDQEAALNLRKVWNTYRKKHKVSQVKFAEEELGWTQGNFSQYLTGGIPIGQKSLLRLCDALDCSPGDIRKEYLDQKMLNDNKVMNYLLKSTLNYLNTVESDALGQEGQGLLEQLNKVVKQAE